MAGLTADSLLPRPAGGPVPGAVLALMAHGLLLLALAWSVNWHARTPEVYSAELWASMPQVAAPKGAVSLPPPSPPEPKPEPPTARVAAPPAPVAPVAPVAPLAPLAPVAPPAPPTPVDPQIAIGNAALADKARRDAAAEAEKKAQQTRAEADRQAQLARKAQADAARQRERQRQDQARREATQRERDAQAVQAAQVQKAEDARLAKLRENNLRRMREQIGAPDATGTPAATGQAARDAAPSASYAGKVAKHIRDNIYFPGEVPGNPIAVVELKTGPGGTVIGHRLLKSSGNREWDEAALRGIERTVSLPRDTDGRVPPLLELSLRPKE